MANSELLKTASLKELATLQIALDKAGGPEADGKLFEDVLLLQDQILKKYGLPSTSDYQELIWFKTIPEDIEINERITHLNARATEYLLTNAKSEIQILREAQEFKYDPYIVLPELKLPTHVYTLFVYNIMLLMHKDSVENILLELKLVNTPEILEVLGQFSLGTLENEHEKLDYLEGLGVKYISQFSMHNSNLLSDDDY